MKMTRLEWRYLQRIALDHPYFDTHALPLTEQEAKAIVDANNRMTGKEFVDSVYANLGMTRPEEEKKHFAKLRSIGELFTVPPIRKIAIVVLVVILMTVFFAATPTGRALAESVIQYIVTLFDDGSLMVSPETAATEIEDFDSDDNLFILYDRVDNEADIHEDMIEAFIQKTGKQPIVLSYPILDIRYVEEKGCVLYISYEKIDGAELSTIQTWNQDISTTLVSSGEFNVCPDDESLFYAYGTTDDGMHFTWLREDSVLIIAVSKRISVEEMEKLLHNSVQ